MGDEYRYTPADLDVLLHYYASPQPYSVGRSVDGEERAKMWEQDEMLYRFSYEGEPSWQCTERAEVWIRYILNTLPLPEYAMPRYSE